MNFNKAAKIILIIITLIYIILAFLLKNHFFNIYTTINIFITLSLFIIDFTRKRYFLPNFTDLSDLQYWTISIVIQSLLPSLYLSTINQGLLKNIAIFYFINISLLTISLIQNNIFVKNKIDSRNSRLESLLKKAGLNKDEVSILKSEIIKNRSNKQPFLWVVYKLLISFFIATLINTYAETSLNFVRYLLSILNK